MSGQRRATGPRRPPTIWRVRDELWAKIEPIRAECNPPKPKECNRITSDPSCLGRLPDAQWSTMEAVAQGASTVVGSIALSSAGSG